ncbi:MAG: hypothetical protein ABSF91_11460 [Bacteroidota bacterium]|jgi:hypothetical protein
MSDLRVIELNPLDIDYPDLYRLGIVKVQMPEQSTTDGTFVIKPSERQRNKELILKVFELFGGSCFSSNRCPNFFLFPELSVTVESAQAIIDLFKSTRIKPNTVVLLGLERIRKGVFLDLQSHSNAPGGFDDSHFGQTINFVNTAIIVAKDKNSLIHYYLQPKLSRSGYETVEQFKSDLIYLFNFGGYQSLVSICSDLFVHEEGTSVVKKVMSSINTHIRKNNRNPRNERIDLWFLLQKNVYPMGDIYDDSVRTLFYKDGHDIETSKTVICSVNSAQGSYSQHYRHSNLCVMDRGRDPETLIGRNSQTCFAWRVISKRPTDTANLPRYVLWRIRDAGVISFILNTDNRNFQINDENLVPVEEALAWSITNTDILKFQEHPEIYELKEFLFSGFEGFVKELFIAPEIREFMGNLDAYLNLFDTLFRQRPVDIFDSLMRIHDERSKIPNCDYWGRDKDMFMHFILSLRLLQIAYSTLKTDSGSFESQGTRFTVVDCGGRQDLSMREKISTSFIDAPKNSVIILQRLIALHNWGGELTQLEDLSDAVKVTKVPNVMGNLHSTARAESPSVIAFTYLTNTINSAEISAAQVPQKTKELLYACFQR